MSFKCFFRGIGTIANDYDILICAPKNFREAFCAMTQILAAIRGAEG